MKKINSFWHSLFFVLCFQTSIFSQSNNTNLPISSSNPLNNGDDNATYGVGTLQNNVDGYQNSALGVNALKNNTTGYRNIGLGYASLLNNTVGHANASIGWESLKNNVSGTHNSAFGYRSLLNITTGSHNIGIGHTALGRIRGGVHNIAIGQEALSFDSNYIATNSGSNNVSIGLQTFTSLTSGNGNIGFGKNSGKNLAVGNFNVFIGSASGPAIPYSEISSQLFIHSNDGEPVSNPLIWGSFSARQLRFNVSANNNSWVEIAATGTRSGLRFNNLTSTFNPSANATKFLTVNQNGDVELRNLPLASGGDDTNIYTHDGTLTADRTMDMADYNLHFNTSNSPSNGKIYIGDGPYYPTATGEYKLYVEGGILTEKVKVALRSTANWADYVFSYDYQLKSLKEVETFIKENKHLPGIESAQELVENGLDLGEMQAKQMGKIEELTLYIIQQDKKLEQQSKDIEELKALVKILMEKK